MPTTKIKPTAASGYSKLVKLLPQGWKSRITYESDKDILTFNVYHRGGFGWFMRQPTARINVYDISVVMRVLDQTFLPDLQQIAQKFEQKDERRIRIEAWRQ
ncbi:hypothetical protein HY502_00425 [Candidatus Woesebacteria bacterium]|nr:hypothetical protein [Candidatus Woesebacteria bacterium]